MGSPRGGEAVRLAITDTRPTQTQVSPPGCPCSGVSAVASPALALPRLRQGLAGPGVQAGALLTPALLICAARCPGVPASGTDHCTGCHLLAAGVLRLLGGARCHGAGGRVLLPRGRGRSRRTGLRAGVSAHSHDFPRDPGTQGPSPCPIPATRRTAGDLNAYCVLPSGCPGQCWGGAEGFMAVQAGRGRSHHGAADLPDRAPRGAVCLHLPGWPGPTGLEG